MKNFKYLLVITLAVFLSGCEKVTDNPKVDEYISSLKAGNYSSFDLPDLSSSDIPALLQYREDKTVITNFPRNGISSFYQADCKLGILVMWTIESIRAVDINSSQLIGRFPSQNPVLTLRSSAELSLVFDDNSMKIAANAYYHWWDAVYLFKDRMSVDPLKDTDYKWH